MRPWQGLALHCIGQHTLRSLVSVLALAVAIAGLTASGVASSQLDNTFDATVDGAAQPDVEIVTSEATMSSVHALAAQNNVTSVQAHADRLGDWVRGPRWNSLDVIGVPIFSRSQRGKYRLIEGSWPRPGQVLMDEGDRSLGSVRAGDRIRIQVGPESHTVVVSGITRTPGRESPELGGPGLIYMSTGTLGALFHASGVNDFQVKFQRYADGKQSMRSLAAALRAQGVLVLSVQWREALVGRRLSDGLFDTLRIVSAIGLGLAVMVLISSMYSLTNDVAVAMEAGQTAKESSRRLVQALFATVFVCALAGSIVGLLLGLLAADLLVRFVSALFGLEVTRLILRPTTLAFSLLAGLMVPMVSALPPSVAVARRIRNPAHPDAVATRMRSWDVALISAFARTALTTAALREALARPLRAFTTLMLVGAACTAFFGAQSVTHSLNRALELRSQAYRADAFVALPRPQQYRPLLRVLSRAPGVMRLEPVSPATAETRWGAVRITGLEPDAALYAKERVKGSWFTVHDTQVAVISEGAAHRSQLRIGDWLTVRGDVHTERWRVVGVAREYGAVGAGPGTFGDMLVPRTEANQLAGMPPFYAGGIMVRSHGGSDTETMRLAERIEQTLGRSGYVATVSTQRQVTDQARKQLTAPFTVWYSVEIMALILGMVGLLSFADMSVGDRRRHIGILRSMGATDRQIARMVWTEALALSLGGWAIAAIAGFPVAYFFMHLTSLRVVSIPLAMSAWTWGYTLLFALAMAALSGVISAWAATRMKVWEITRRTRERGQWPGSLGAEPPAVGTRRITG